MSDDHERHRGGLFRSPTGYVFVVFVAIGGYFLWTEHRAHLWSILPFLILLLCPIMHLFHGHGGHGDKGNSGEHSSHGKTGERS
ncbi:MAG: DUF2933 domain-containing protein [Alphaproteobacteria bacterium]